MPRKSDDLDFNIHIDQSCLSTPMDEEISIVKSKGEAETPLSELSQNDENPSPEASEKDTDATVNEEENDSKIDEPVTLPQQETAVTSELDPQDTAAEVAQVAVEEIEADANGQSFEESPPETHDEEDKPSESLVDNSDVLSTPDETEAVNQTTDESSTDSEKVKDNDETPRASQMVVQDDQDASCREPGGSDRKTSMRTEAIIQAEAEAVVAQTESDDSARKSGEAPCDDADADKSLLSNLSDAYDDDHDVSFRESADPGSRRSSTNSHAPNAVNQDHSEGEAGGDSSDHHDNDDDDVFSDHSPCSSLASVNADGLSDRPESSKSGDYKSGDYKSGDYKSRNRDRGSSHGCSARISGISEFSQFDTGSHMEDGEEYAMPTKTTPRQPFRSISDVRAMQMSSPAPSVFSTPRSSKRPGNIPQSVSRTGSPGVSAQYSPKGRSTPPRFRVKKESAPLVLLHCTLLPLRWAWAEVLNEGRLDLDEASEGGFKPSEELKGLRDNWRLLQDRMGDTVLERGILLPHPEADYEVLEERLLEALELPLRRRARILECGHYLGPSNITEIDEDATDSEFEDDAVSTVDQKESDRDKRHWCATCKHDIRFESLGPGRIFRVKVYASNGLMKAGAWTACWKEMERVDVEVEPIVEPAVQGELERLESWQAAERRKFEARDQEVQEGGHRAVAAEDVFNFEERDDIIQSIEQDDFRQSFNGSAADQTVLHHQFSSPRAIRSPSPRPMLQASSPPPPSGHGRMSVEPRERDGDRRRREEERLREIYGHQLSESRGGSVRANSRHVRQYSNPGQYGYSSPTPQDTSAMAVDGSHRKSDSRSLAYQDAYRLPSPPTRAARVDESGSPVRADYRSNHQYDNSYMPQNPSPTPPNEQQAYIRQEERRAPNTSQNRRRGDESLPELLLEAAKVLMRDRRNVAIAALSVIAVFFALKQPEYSLSRVSGVQEREAEIARSIYLHQQQQQQQQQQQRHFEQYEVTQMLAKPAAYNPAMAVAQQAPIVDVMASVLPPQPPVISVIPSSAQSMEPEAAPPVINAASAPANPPVVKAKKKKVVKVYETITETVKVTATKVASAISQASNVNEEEEGEEIEVNVVTETQTVKLPAETEAVAAAREAKVAPQEPEFSSPYENEARSDKSNQVPEKGTEDPIEDALNLVPPAPEMEELLIETEKMPTPEFDQVHEEL